MSGLCGDCRHWSQPIYAGAPPNARNKRVGGTCLRVPFVEDEGGEDAPAVIESDGPHYGVYLMTAPDFGCTEFAAKGK